MFVRCGECAGGVGPGVPGVGGRALFSRLKEELRGGGLEIGDATLELPLEEVRGGRGGSWWLVEN